MADDIVASNFKQNQVFLFLINISELMEDLSRIIDYLSIIIEEDWLPILIEGRTNQMQFKKSRLVFSYRY